MSETRWYHPPGIYRHRRHVNRRVCLVMETPSEKILSVRRDIDDLVALTALPALWREFTPQAIVESLTDVLLSTLHLDMVYVCLQGGVAEIEIVRTPQRLYIGELAKHTGSI